MKVFYRIYPGKPDNRPFANGDKKTLVRTCLWSFLQSCRQSKTEIQLTILLDRCPDEWTNMVHYLAFDVEHNIVALDGIGNKPSFLKQLEMALDGPDDEFVYFAEDDYLYRPMAVEKMLSFIQYAHFITPYDHPDRYRRGDDRFYQGYIEVCDDWHWRTVESTTMTFGAERGMIKSASGLMREWACEGRKMWYPILNRNYFLWSPIPSLATHVHDGVLAHCVDWERLWNQYA